jgi:Tol biopolymer transport system component
MRAIPVIRLLSPTPLTLILSLLLMPTGIPGQTQAEDLFQQALRMERVTGDLEGAISIYQQVVDMGDRPLGARALIRIAENYELLGRQGAQDAYARIIEDFGDQAEQVELARERLAALAQPRPALGAGSIQIRRLMGGRYPDEVDMEMAPTPDGRSMVRIDWESANLHLWDLSTRESKAITAYDPELGYPGFGIVSPDGRWLAYPFYRVGEQEGAFGISGADLRVVGMDGSDPQAFHAGWVLYPGSWSPDSRHVAVTIHRSDDSTTEIARISVDDGSEETLWTFDYPGRFFAGPKHSPDDRFVAVRHPVQEDSARGDITLIATDGSGIKPLIDHPADDDLIGWVPGTQDLLFTSDRSGDRDLWAVRVEEDGTAGRPWPVRRGIGELNPRGFTRDGTLFYSNYTLQYNISIAPFDQGSGKIRFRDSEALGGLGANMRPDWSPDGEHLALVRRRSSPPGRGFGMKGFEEVIHVRDLETGLERSMAEDIAPATTGAPVWFPDGKSLLVLGMPQEMSGGVDWGDVPSAVYRVDAETGEATPLFEFPPDNHWWSRVRVIPTPDGEGVIYSRKGRIVRRELATGDETELFQDSLLAPAVLFLSPDGSKLVFGVNRPLPAYGNVDPRVHKGGSLMTMPVNGGPARELFRVEDEGRVGFVFWNPDGSRLFFGLRAEDGTSLFGMDPEGGEAERLFDADERLAGLSLSPSGDRLAYWVQENEAEIWVMENLVAALREGGGGR